MKNFLKVAPFLFTIALISCDSNKVYQDFQDFEEGFWHQDSLVQFSFTVEDASMSYHGKSLFRYTQEYPYHNMYYQLTLKNSSDSILSQELKQILLFDPKTGEPNGSGIGNYFDIDQMVLENYTFPDAGTYQVSIQQYMRLDTLPFLVSAGWRLERPAD